MIIKNCPALINKKNCISAKTSETECEKCKTCTIKTVYHACERVGLYTCKEDLANYIINLLEKKGDEDV